MTRCNKTSSRKFPNNKTQKFKVIEPYKSSAQPINDNMDKLTPSNIETESSSAAPVQNEGEIQREIVSNDDSTPEISDIFEILKQVIIMQDKTLKVLSSIQDSLVINDNNAADNSDFITSKMDEISFETKNAVSKIEKISDNLVASQTTLHEKLVMNTKAECTANLVLQSKNEELTNILLREKKEKALQTKCARIKRNLSIQWTQALVERKKHYSNFVKNYKKNQLYTNWIKSSPNFLPLKYKPKRIPGETLEHTDARINEARQRYRNDVALMLNYAKVHQSRVSAIDEEMKKLAKNSCETDEEASCLQSIWRHEAAEQETIAAQTWVKTERFLTRKKHEDKARKEETLTSMSWDEKLSQRRKNRN